MPIKEPANPGRTADGRFAPGNKLGPPGRKQGSRNRMSRAMLDQIREAGPDVINTVVQAARQGDMQACKIIIDRVVPNLKDFPLDIDVPPINSARDIQSAVQILFNKTTTGEITLDQFERLIGALTNASKIAEMVELEERIQRLEQLKLD